MGSILLLNIRPPQGSEYSLPYLLFFMLATWLHVLLWFPTLHSLPCLCLLGLLAQRPKILLDIYPKDPSNWTYSELNSPSSLSKLLIQCFLLRWKHWRPSNICSHLGHVVSLQVLVSILPRSCPSLLSSQSFSLLWFQSSSPLPSTWLSCLSSCLL